MKKFPTISIIIPVWNEERRLPRLFVELRRCLNTPAAPAFIKEVIFVNDGSTDRTLELIESFKAGQPVKIISYERNRGKGYAVRVGMGAFTADYCLIADADVSTPFEEIGKFLPALNAGKAVIIGSRKGRGAIVKVRQPFYREQMGKVFTFLANFITGVSVSDFTCGFKFFRRDVARRVAALAFIDRWSYDAELLFLVCRLGFSIEEINVEWSNNRQTSVRLLKDSAKSLIDLIRLRFHNYSL
jgi:dolichyl-phosphate beta-glucosyltransferase